MSQSSLSHVDRQASSTGDAGQRFLESGDLLPIVLLCLKDLILDASLDENNPSWQGAFLSLLVVNKAFFLCAADCLWETMENISPIFRLLPWYSSGPYEGVGVYEYQGPKDWERFLLYSSRVKHIMLQGAKDDVESFHPNWVLQLLALPDRPPLLFNSLQRVKVTPRANHLGHLLFLFIGPSIRFLELSSFGQSEQSFVFGVLPLLARPTINVATFHYWGNGGHQLFHHMSKFHALTDVRLYLGRSLAVDDLKLLCCLKNLTKLEILFRAPTESQAIAPTTTGETINTSYRAFPKLSSLGLRASATSVLLLHDLFSPSSLETVHISFGGGAPCDIRAIGHIFATNLQLLSSLHTLHIEFGLHEGPTPAFPASSNTGVVHSTEAVRKSLLSMEDMANLSFSESRPWVASFLLPIVLEVIPHMKKLKRLHFSLQAKPSFHDTAGISFPGLRLLSTIRRYCPKLEELELPFDDNRIVGEIPSPQNFNLTPTTFDHPLRILVLSTVQATIGVSIEKKSHLALYLSFLFPRLETVKGSDSSTWSDVNVLVASYRTAERMRRQIESF